MRQTGLAIVALAGLILMGCGGATSQSPRPTPKSVTVGWSNSFVSCLDFGGRKGGTTGSGIGLVSLGNVGETLVRRDAGSVKMLPLLATRWQLDGTNWRFWLRTGVKFSNGEPLNADAVLFSWDIHRHLGAGQLIGFVDHVTAVDPYQVMFVMKSANPDILIRFDHFAIAPPVAGQNVDAMCDKPIGTGPYVVSAHTLDQLVLVKNTAYWGGQTKGPDKVTIVSRPALSSRIAGLQSGELDLALGITTDQVKQVPKFVQSSPGTATLTLNGAHGVFLDPNVRRAVVLAVDRSSIVKSLFAGLATATTCQWGRPGDLGYNPDLKAQPYDPTAAKQLIQQAGAQGASVTITFREGSPGYSAGIADLLRQQLTAIGLKPEIRVLTSADYGKIFGAPPAQHPDILWGDAGGDSGLAYDAASTYVFPAGSGSQTFDNSADYALAKPLIDVLLNEQDQAKRIMAAQKLEAVVCNSNQLVFMYHLPLLDGVQKNLSYTVPDDEITGHLDLASLTGAK